MEPKEFYNTVYRPDHPFHYGGSEEGMPERTRLLAKDTCAWLEQTGLAYRKDAKILELGCGMAFLSQIHPGWHGAEYSSEAVRRVKERDGETAQITECDAQNMIFEDCAFDGIFTWAALEHVPDPHRALCEIDRVLRPGGRALIGPAWNCRPWTVKKLEDRFYFELTLKEKIEKGLIPFRELFWVRALRALPGRIVSEFRLISGRLQRLKFRPLRPRWDLIQKYGHVSDDDALAEIDPHSAICFFKSRGYRIISHPTFKARFLSRHHPLRVNKPL